MKVFTILIFLLLLSGCNIQADDRKTEEKRVKETIREYNRLLAEGYKKMDMNDLRKVATREHVEKVYLHMAALGEEGKKMIAIQREIVINKIKFLDRENVEVRTTEVWDYKHIDYIKDEVVRDEKNVSYNLLYKLRKIPYHGWVVEDVRMTDKSTVQQ